MFLGRERNYRELMIMYVLFIYEVFIIVIFNNISIFKFGGC